MEEKMEKKPNSEYILEAVDLCKYFKAGRKQHWSRSMTEVKRKVINNGLYEQQLSFLYKLKSEPLRAEDA